MHVIVLYCYGTVLVYFVVARQTQAYLYLALGIRELSLCMYTERKGGGQVLQGLGSSALAWRTSI